MIVKHYYKATRDPSKGGLHIATTSSDFPDEWRKFIQENVLELIAADYKNDACAVCPMGDGKFIVSMAQKVCGNKMESRPHEVIHGIVLDSTDFIKLCRNNMAQEWFPQIFFPTITKGELELAGEGFFEVMDEEDFLGEFKKNIKGHRLIGFYKMLTEIIDKKRKVQLIVPKGLERVVQALCYDVLQKEERNHLFVISNGECTMTDADILITEKITHQNPRKYRTMTWDEFISYGIQLQGKKKVEEKIKKMTEEEALDSCKEYIEVPNQPESTIAIIRRELMGQSKETCKDFQMKLRYELEMLDVNRKCIPNYVKILCLAFENFQGECEDTTQTMLPLPYDVQGIQRFLATYCISKWERKRFEKAIMDLCLRASGWKREKEK